MVDKRTIGVVAIMMILTSLGFLAGDRTTNDVTFIGDITWDSVLANPENVYLCESRVIFKECMDTIKDDGSLRTALSDTAKTCYGEDGRGTRCSEGWSLVTDDSIIKTPVSVEPGEIKVTKVTEGEDFVKFRYCFNFKIEEGRTIEECHEAKLMKPLPDEFIEIKNLVSQHAVKTFDEKYNKPVIQEINLPDHKLIGENLN